MTHVFVVNERVLARLKREGARCYYPDCPKPFGLGDVVLSNSGKRCHKKCRENHVIEPLPIWKRTKNG